MDTADSNTAPNMDNNMFIVTYLESMEYEYDSTTPIAVASTLEKAKSSIADHMKTVAECNASLFEFMACSYEVKSANLETGKISSIVHLHTPTKQEWIEASWDRVDMMLHALVNDAQLPSQQGGYKGRKAHSRHPMYS